MHIRNAESVFNKEDLFKCYSLNLSRFLCDSGLFFIKRGINKSTNKFYFIFVKTDELCALLEYWKFNNPNNRVDTIPQS